MIERVTQADFSFVMYYAPWDAESQMLRQEFESVARFYHPQVRSTLNHPIYDLMYIFLCIHKYVCLCS